MNNAIMAGDRFFRLYYKYTVEPDLDTLFNLLNSVHSLNDRLKKSQNEHFYKNDEFITLKVLRNFFHHQEELLNKLLILPLHKLSNVHTDLLYACLVPINLVELSIKGIHKDFKVQQEPVVRNVLHWYGKVTNINPCVFNFAVCVYEKINELGLQLQSDEFFIYQESYQEEENNGHSHYVDGKIYSTVGNASDFLSSTYSKYIA